MVEIDVGDDRYAAVPRMGGIEPPAQTDLDEHDVGPGLGEIGEDDSGQQLELGRLAVAPGNAIRGRKGAPDQAGEVGGRDRSAVHRDPFAVAHQVRLGRAPDAIAGRTQRRIGECEDAALAVGPGDQRAPERSFRMIELAQQRPRPTEPQTDPEPPALGQCRERFSVGETGRRLGHRGTVTRGTARPRRRRTG